VGLKSLKSLNLTNGYPNNNNNNNNNKVKSKPLELRSRVKSHAWSCILLFVFSGGIFFCLKKRKQARGIQFM
jgi:hypothetical protein